MYCSGQWSTFGFFFFLFCPKCLEMTGLRACLLGEPPSPMSLMLCYYIFLWPLVTRGGLLALLKCMGRLGIGKRCYFSLPEALCVTAKKCDLLHPSHALFGYQWRYWEGTSSSPSRKVLAVLYSLNSEEIIPQLR